MSILLIDDNDPAEIMFFFNFSNILHHNKTSLQTMENNCVSGSNRLYIASTPKWRNAVTTLILDIAEVSSQWLILPPV